MTDTSRNRKKQWQQIYQVFSFIFFFITDTYGQLQYSVHEEMKKGSVVGNVAKDLGLSVDELANRKFQVLSQTNKQYFSVNLENGDLFVSDRIDRETLCGNKPNCFINLEAVIENPLTFYTITIEIQDMNDNSPIFADKYFEVEISEVTSPGARFALGNAQDPDLGSNSIQSYTLTGNENFGLGERITTDGIKYPEIIMEKSLDREKQSYYELILTALDGGNPQKSSTATVRIIVQDFNDKLPMFNQDTYHVRLHEDAAIGSLVIHLNATDEDEGSNAEIAYSFSHISDNARQLFTIDSLNGDIKVIGNLDYEISDSYELTVVAKDGGGHVTHCKVSVQVIDVNDNAPDILMKSFSETIPEDSPPGTVVSLLNIRDLDSGMNSEVVCHISDTLAFQLIPSSSTYYKLVTAASMDRERYPSYNVTIQCMDGGSPPLSTNKTIQLNISDVNDNAPVFEKMKYILYIGEKNQPGASIHNVRASDPDGDENGKISYSILNSNVDDIPVTSYISINPFPTFDAT
ncbi:unnamed protein product [Ranitomeya imitator]|uniref:Cadherin domain-containing protein n=1 Tax=Ranitomeya imitator TaxID=111125 RepID=A0ABN9M772_9NEOB|nr:unnamed protein product [Ranitomeya imitator]